MLCNLCDALSIERLLDLYTTSGAPSFDAFRAAPDSVWFAHHASYADLVRSAQRGCPLCRAIWASCRQPTKFHGVTRNDSIDGLLERRRNSKEKWEENVTMCLSHARPAVMTATSLIKPEQGSAEKVPVVAAPTPALASTPAPAPTSASAAASSGSPCNGDIACGETTDGETDLVVTLPVGKMGRPFHEGHEIVLNSLHVRFGSGTSATLDLRISRPREQSISVNNFIIGAYDIVPDLAADANYAIAKSWLATCQSAHHSACSPIEPVALPARVLDLGTVGRPETLRLLETGGAKGIYLTLSHCWGKSASMLQTTTANIGRLKGDIPFSTLPKTFRDAVVITRKLGFQYLWIDSLCIIQDSRSDWEAQAAVMGDIYENSALTIAAAAAPNADIGMLNTYQHPNLVGTPIAMRVDAARQSPRRALVRPIPVDEEGLKECLTTAPLAARGWTLQERHLSRRVLYYGRRQVYWECRGAQCAADGEQEGAASDKIGRFLGASQGPGAAADPHSRAAWLAKLYSSWYDLLAQYCKRQLTVPADKLPALAGLAARFARLSGDRYVAGLWEGDFRRGLLWFVWSHPPPPPPPGGPRRAPSWSWAARDAEVYFVGNESDVVVDGACDVQVRERDVQLAGRDPFGCVAAAARLVVEGYTWPLARVRAGVVGAAPASKGKSECVFDAADAAAREWLHAIMYDAPNGRFVYERPGGDGEGGEAALTMLFVCATARAARKTGEESPCALILRAVDEERGVYERVGFTRMAPGVPGRFSEAWSKTTLTLI